MERMLKTDASLGMWATDCTREATADGMCVALRFILLVVPVYTHANAVVRCELVHVGDRLRVAGGLKYQVSWCTSSLVMTIIRISCQHSFDQPITNL